MSLYRTKALVLKCRNFGEADRVLVLLSEDHGKLEAVVKGARRPRSRFVGNTLPFNLLQTLLLTGKSLETLSQAELLHSFSSLREDLIRMAYASFWAELVDRFVPEREEAREIFRFLLAAFVTLEGDHDPGLLNLAFQARLLNYLGYQPELDGCVGCGTAEADFRFSAQAGGLVCPECREQYRDLIPVDRVLIDGLQRIAVTDLRQLAQLDLTSGQRQSLLRLLRSFIEARMDQPLKSQLFLDHLLSSTSP
ncbi:DNA replication and repair protein RecO [Hydrogenispora ethanolica]|uniref:DNA repair protein RecO n=1 Tax=Hydrogenispora ethanolica TaxID=1082276 RepID=A0A4R1R935_HYDET|nr:DNA repair protein RecO [Hydrogenispora ethanolica]TCL62186.1 DNA replication and repair protein RecO [Hydrogenispora ethanolica]